MSRYVFLHKLGCHITLISRCSCLLRRLRCVVCFVALHDSSLRDWSVTLKLVRKISVMPVSFGSRNFAWPKFIATGIARCSNRLPQHVWLMTQNDTWPEDLYIFMRITSCPLFLILSFIYFSQPNVDFVVTFKYTTCASE